VREFEKKLYPLVGKWLKKRQLCFKTAQNTGLIYSRADVIGVRDIGGTLTGEVETIVVEVKRGTEPFATAAGQALGYTIYANKVYLADKRETPFTQDELYIASHLGIGLIQITENKCIEVLSSPYHKPITKYNTLLLEKLALGKCQFCESFFEIGKGVNSWMYMSRKVNNAVKKWKGLIFWNWEVAKRKQELGIIKKEDTTSERRYICPDCVQYIVAPLKQ
jgi:hypothetical protein